MSDKEYDPSGLFYVGAVVLSLFFLWLPEIFFVYSTGWDLIKQHIYDFSLSLFCLTDWVTVYEDQMLYYFWNS